MFKISKGQTYKYLSVHLQLMNLMRIIYISQRGMIIFKTQLKFEKEKDLMIRKITTQFLRNTKTKIAIPLAKPVLMNHQRFLFSQENDKQQNKPLTKQEMFRQKEEQMMKEDDAGSFEKNQSNIGKYLMLLSIGALLMLYGMMEIQTIRSKQKTDRSITGLTKVQSTGKAYIGGDWELLDTKGNVLSSKSLEGTYYLIYFGFCNCPDICPNSLIKLSKAIERLKKMPQFQYVKLKTIFVSVDPDRDTPEKIEKFVTYFDKEFIGVTGKSNDDPKLRQAMKKFKIYASKIEFPEDNPEVKGRFNYTIDHTILTYLMSDTNEYITHLGANLGEHELAKQIIDKILENEKEKMKMMKV